MSSFDKNRFLKVLAYDLKQVRNTYGKALLVAMLAPFMWWLMKTAFDGSFSMFGRAYLIYLDFVLVLIVAPSQLYARVNQGNKGIYYAMLPASKTEKYLSMWLICAVILPTALAAVLFGMDCLLASLPFGSIHNNVVRHEEARYLWQAFDSHDDINLLDFSEGRALLVLNLFATLHSTVAYFMLTNTIFTKVKTILSILVLWVLSIVISPIFMIISFARMSNLENLEQLTEVSWSTLGGITALVQLLIAVLLYYITYYRLKKMAY